MMQKPVYIQSINVAQRKIKNIRRSDFAFELDESYSDSLEKIIGSKYLLLRRPWEDINTYAQRIYDAFPELQLKEDILLGIAILLHRKKIYEDFSLPL